MLCKKLCDDFDSASGRTGLRSQITSWWWFIEGNDVEDEATDAAKRSPHAARHKKLPAFTTTNGSSSSPSPKSTFYSPPSRRLSSIPFPRPRLGTSWKKTLRERGKLAIFVHFSSSLVGPGLSRIITCHDVPDVISFALFDELTWLKASAPEFQFFTSSNGKVGMKGVLAVPGAKPCVKKLASVIGTVTGMRTERGETLNK
jgi:hypothetical protein